MTDDDFSLVFAEGLKSGQNQGCQSADRTGEHKRRYITC